MVKEGYKTKAKFPPKTILHKSTDKKTMTDRQEKLTAYLASLLAENPKARADPKLNDFLSPSRTFVVEQ